MYENIYFIDSLNKERLEKNLPFSFRFKASGRAMLITGILFLVAIPIAIRGGGYLFEDYPVAWSAFILFLVTVALGIVIHGLYEAYARHKLKTEGQVIDGQLLAFNVEENYVHDGYFFMYRARAEYQFRSPHTGSQVTKVVKGMSVHKNKFEPAPQLPCPVKIWYFSDRINELL